MQKAIVSYKQVWAANHIYMEQTADGGIEVFDMPTHFAERSRPRSWHIHSRISA